MDRMAPDAMCAFCGRGKEEQKVCGKLYSQQLDTGNTLAAHKKCMQYSSKLNQHEFEHFGGFEIDEVEREIKRGKKLKCFWCKQSRKRATGATSGCELKGCPKSFHFYCAAEHPQSKTWRGKSRGQDCYWVFCSEKHKQDYRKTPEGQQDETCNETSEESDDCRDPGNDITVAEMAQGTSSGVQNRTPKSKDQNGETSNGKRRVRAWGEKSMSWIKSVINENDSDSGQSVFVHSLSSSDLSDAQYSSGSFGSKLCDLGPLTTNGLCLPNSSGMLNNDSHVNKDECGKRQQTCSSKTSQHDTAKNKALHKNKKRETMQQKKNNSNRKKPVLSSSSDESEDSKTLHKNSKRETMQQKKSNSNYKNRVLRSSSDEPEEENDRISNFKKHTSSSSSDDSEEENHRISVALKGPTIPDPKPTGVSMSQQVKSRKRKHSAEKKDSKEPRNCASKSKSKRKTSKLKSSKLANSLKQRGKLKPSRTFWHKKTNQNLHHSKKLHTAAAQKNHSQKILNKLESLPFEVLFSDSPEHEDCLEETSGQDEAGNKAPSASSSDGHASDCVAEPELWNEDESQECLGQCEPEQSHNGDLEHCASVSCASQDSSESAEVTEETSAQPERGCSCETDSAVQAASVDLGMRQEVRERLEEELSEVQGLQQFKPVSNDQECAEVSRKAAVQPVPGCSHEEASCRGSRAADCAAQAASRDLGTGWEDQERQGVQLPEIQGLEQLLHASDNRECLLVIPEDPSAFKSVRQEVEQLLSEDLAGDKWHVHTWSTLHPPHLLPPDCRLYYFYDLAKAMEKQNWDELEQLLLSTRTVKEKLETSYVKSKMKGGNPGDFTRTQHVEIYRQLISLCLRKASKANDYLMGKLMSSLSTSGPVYYIMFFITTICDSKQNIRRALHHSRVHPLNPGDDFLPLDTFLPDRRCDYVHLESAVLWKWFRQNFSKDPYRIIYIPEEEIFRLDSGRSGAGLDLLKSRLAVDSCSRADIPVMILMMHRVKANLIYFENYLQACLSHYIQSAGRFHVACVFPVENLREKKCPWIELGIDGCPVRFFSAFDPSQKPVSMLVAELKRERQEC